MKKKAPKKLTLVNKEQPEQRTCCPLHTLLSKYGMSDKDFQVMAHCLAANEFTAIQVIFHLYQVTEQDGEVLVQSVQQALVQHALEQALGGNTGTDGTRLN